MPGTKVQRSHCRGLLVAACLVFLLQTSPTLAQEKKPAAKQNTKKTPKGDTFGYSQAFADELQEIGEISAAEFAKRYAPKGKYLKKISFDATNAKYWNQFNAEKWRRLPVRGVYDFRLNQKELAVFRKNGFVVTERHGAASFGEMFYRIYSRDLPLYVSSDALLHAWHRSYDAMLEELEETYLSVALDELLSGMAAQIPAAQKAYGSGVLEESVKDTDYFLAVARSLLKGKQVPTHMKQDKRVKETLKACDKLKLQKCEIFGRLRTVDFSQFKVRGHYENSELLKRYFKSMMWCGRIDLRIAGGFDADGGLSSGRELGAAVVFSDLLERSGKFKLWQQFDQMIQTFVGRTDSMTFGQLKGILKAGKIKSARDVKSLKSLQRLEQQILSNKIGVQHIRGHVFYSPLGIEKVQLPRSFTLLGQKFVMDSWVTSKVVFDDIIWQKNAVPRRIPSCLDVAFAAFGNNAITPLLVERIHADRGRKFRDGLQYQHNLAAVRNIIDRQKKEVWRDNLYNHWLATLRELSKPTTDKKYPEAMRTKAWAMKGLNSQLASWTQLRHDTILYVKQSYTAGAKCEYPAGFVEPVPHFWSRLEQMATAAAKLIEETPYPKRDVFKEVGGKGGVRKIKVSLKQIQKEQAAFFRNFAKQVGTLKGIATKELNQKPLTPAETKFLKEIVRVRSGSGFTVYNGWYPQLFYKGKKDCAKWDALVADVHTDVPAPVVGDPGCVLTQGVGNVDLLYIAINNGKDTMAYAGPVLSHYEFEMPGVSRMVDSEWRKKINQGKLPPRPEWTRSYLVTGTNPWAKHYRAR